MSYCTKQTELRHHNLQRHSFCSNIMAEVGNCCLSNDNSSDLWIGGFRSFFSNNNYNYDNTSFMVNSYLWNMLSMKSGTMAMADENQRFCFILDCTRYRRRSHDTFWLRFEFLSVTLLITRVGDLEKYIFEDITRTKQRIGVSLLRQIRSWHQSARISRACLNSF